MGQESWIYLLMAHFLFPGERLTPLRALGLALAMGGVALALLERGSGAASWTGDLLALMAALCWAGIVLCVRLTPLREVPPAQQLMCQVTYDSVGTGQQFHQPVTRQIVNLRYHFRACLSIGIVLRRNNPIDPSPSASGVDVDLSQCLLGYPAGMFDDIAVHIDHPQRSVRPRPGLHWPKPSVR